MPVWVVVSLLGAFVTTPLSVVVLACVEGRHAIEVTVGSVQAQVPLPEATVEVVGIVLVHAVLQVSVAVKVIALGRISGDGPARGVKISSCMVEIGKINT